jgi:hypothetical protein
MEREASTYYHYGRKRGKKSMTNNRVTIQEKRIDKFSQESFPDGTSEESKELIRLLKPYGGYEGYLRHLLGMPDEDKSEIIDKKHHKIN